MKDGRRVPTREPKDYKVALQNEVEPTVVVQRPFAYLFPASFTGAIETLQRHGITVEELREDIEVDLQVYKVERLTKADRVFQNHNLVTVEVARRDETRKVNAGLSSSDARAWHSARIPAQPQADGLTAWNIFDTALGGKDFRSCVCRKCAAPRGQCNRCRKMMSKPITPGFFEPPSPATP